MVSRRALPATVLSVLVVAMFLITSIGAALGQDKPDRTEDERVPNAVQQGGEGIPPQVTPYYVNAVSGSAIARGQLSPIVLHLNDTLAEIQVPGPRFPKRTLSRAGIFEMQISQHHPLEVYGISLVSVWAKSNEDAQNAEFRILFQRNGGTVANMYTNRAGLSNIPMEFQVTDPTSFTEPIIYNTGDTMSIEIQYRASSRYVVGPAPSCVLLANSIAHSTRIELMAHPMDANVSNPTFVQEADHKHIQINGKIWDSYGVDPPNDLIINLEIRSTGTTNIPPGTIKQMNFNPKEDEIVVNWTWEYRKSTVIDGLFEFKIDISYGVPGHNYTNSSFFELKFPKAEETAGGFLQGGNLTFLLVGVVAAVLVIAIVFWRRSRAPYPSGYQRHPGPSSKPKMAKKPKMSRAQKKAMTM